MSSRAAVDRSRLWTGAATALLLAILVGSPAAGDAAEIERLAGAGKKALAAGRYDQAQELLAKGLSLAEEESEEQWAIRMFFYRALGYQAQAEAQGDDRALYERAARLYLGVLERKPTSGSTMVNLAQVYGKLGRRDESKAAFQRAIALDDDSRAVYENKYAEYLNQVGDAKGAASYYKGVVEKRPSSSRAQKGLLEAYLDPEVGEAPLLEYLWAQVEAGEVLRAEDGALRALERGWPEGTRRELLTLVVASLAKRFEDPRVFEKSTSLERLRALAGDPVVGDGINELLGLWRSRGKIKAGSIRWWAQGSSRKRPPRGVWPRDAVRDLLRRLASWHEQQGDWKSAEGYYQAAAVFAGGEVDPSAIRSLVGFYVRQGQIERVQKVADQFVKPLFIGKGDAIRSREDSQIYLYHRALGETYAYLAQGTGDWGGSREPASAVFQLEHARIVGQRLEDKTGETYVDPQLVNLLAAAYDGTGRAADKNELILNTAERYQARGDAEASRQVMQRLDTDSLKRRDKRRVRELRKPLVERYQGLERVEAAAAENAGDGADD